MLVCHLRVVGVLLVDVLHRQGRDRGDLTRKTNVSNTNSTSHQKNPLFYLHCAVHVHGLVRPRGGGRSCRRRLDLHGLILAAVLSLWAGLLGVAATLQALEKYK